jgi:hypothetical protein
MPAGSPRTRISEDGLGRVGGWRVHPGHLLLHPGVQVAADEMLPPASSSGSGGLSLATVWRSP